MRINALREEITALFRTLSPPRPPALRRSLRTEWLYAADLPQLYGRDRLQEVMIRIMEAGWEIREEEGWLQIRKPAPEPPEGWFEGPFGPEADCCVSLLHRHPGKADAEMVQRLLIKAGEEGPDAYEAACSELHREWAELLRKHQELPSVSRRYFGERKERGAC